MYNKYKEIFSSIVDTEAILAEAMAIGGDRPHSDLVMALTVKAIADKQQLQINQLMDQVFVKTKSLQELEDEGKLWGVPKPIDLSSVRNIRDANEALDESIELLDQNAKLKTDFDNERKHAAALNPEITIGDEWDSKDIYLERFSSPHNVRTVVGIHAMGHAGFHQYNLQHLDKSVETISTDFMCMEVWGNEYDSMNEKEQVMIGRGSFRCGHSQIDLEVKDWEAEGWKRIPNPWKKNESKT